MRLPRGKQVEVWIADAAPNMGAWRAGEVIEGDGHKYSIKWSDGGPDPGRIMRKFVRPRPKPDVQLPKDVAPGDIVELFDNNLWKLVEVVRLGDHQFDVKFFDYTDILTVDVSVLRPRLKYGVDGWSLIHKNIESPIPSRPIAGKNIKRKATGSGIGKDGSNFAAHAVKLGDKKRSNCTADSNIVRDVKRFQGDTNRLFAKGEEPAARHNDNIEVMDVHPNHYLKKRKETGNNVDVYLAQKTDSDKEDAVSKSDTKSSSTSDTSTSDSSDSSGSNGSGGDCATSATVEHCQENQEADIQLLPRCNEVEQDSDSNRKLQHHQANEVQGVMKQEQHDRRLHVLELEAYVSVMKAFHATGSLTWAKEELLSDLRLHLNISSDEHLQVIWDLNGKKKPVGGPRNDNSVCH